MKKIFILLLITLLLSGCNINNSSQNKNVNNNTKKMSKKLNNNELLINSKLIAEQLISYVFSKEDLNGKSELSDLNLFHFFISTSYYKDNPLYLYSDYHIPCTGNDKTNILFRLDDVQKIIKEISGKKQWFINFSNTYDEEEKNFVIPTGIETIGIYSTDVIDSKTTDKNTIEVKCKLFNRLGFEENKKFYGTYKITFKIIKEKNKDYLRFENFKKWVPN